MPKKQPDLWQPMLLDVGTTRPKPEEKKPEPVVEYDTPLLRARPKAPPVAPKKQSEEAPWWHRVRKIENDPDHAAHPVLAWGGAWNRLIAGEGWIEDLSAGKRQVLESCVRGLDVRPGVIEGSVVSGQKKPQRVQLRMNSLTQADWARIVRQVIDDGTEAGAVTALESHTVPVALIDAADRHGMPLVPRRLVAIVAACTCGGARLPCDHVIAVHLSLARKLDAEPLVLLEFRGGRTTELLELFKRVREELRSLPEAAPATEVDPFLPGAGPDPDWSLLDRPPTPRPPLPLPEGWRARETFDAMVRRLIAAVRQAGQRTPGT